MSLDTNSIGLGWASFSRSSLTELIDVARVSGFKTITVAPHLYFDARERGISDRELRQRLSDAGVKVTAIESMMRGLPGVPPVDEISSDFRRLFAHGEDDVYRAAEALHAGELGVAQFLGRPVPLSNMAAAISGICERAKEKGLWVTVEFIPDTGIPDLATAGSLYEMIKAECENLRLVVDMWHVSRSGGSPETISLLPKDSIRVIQICDRKTPTVTQAYVPMSGRELPGEGNLPLSNLLTAALKNSPSARIDVEVIRNKRLEILSVLDRAKEMRSATTQWVQKLDS